MPGQVDLSVSFFTEHPGTININTTHTGTSGDLHVSRFNEASTIDFTDFPFIERTSGCVFIQVKPRSNSRIGLKVEGLSWMNNRRIVTVEGTNALISKLINSFTNF